jgi:hypothetical protein
MKNLILFISFIFLFFSCEKDKPVNPVDPEPNPNTMTVETVVNFNYEQGASANIESVKASLMLDGQILTQKTETFSAQPVKVNLKLTLTEAQLTEHQSKNAKLVVEVSDSESSQIKIKETTLLIKKGEYSKNFNFLIPASYFKLDIKMNFEYGWAITLTSITVRFYTKPDTGGSIIDFFDEEPNDPNPVSKSIFFEYFGEEAINHIGEERRLTFFISFRDGGGTYRNITKVVPFTVNSGVNQFEETFIWPPPD